VGLVIGMAGALASTRLLTSLLFEVTAMNPGIFLAAAALLMLVAILASYLPARRATLVDRCRHCEQTSHLSHASRHPAPRAGEAQWHESREQKGTEVMQSA